MKRRTHTPGTRTHRGPLGWVVLWVDPWGETRPLTAPCDEEEAAEDAVRDALGSLPPAQRRARVR